MTISLYNTLHNKSEEFKPIDSNHITMYVCGPTVYDKAHIGNARAMVVFDVLYRVLKNQYPKVTYVRNITDVDDKINKAASDLNISIEQLTKETTKFFHKDMQALSCLPPDIEPRATKHIKEMIAMIKQLIANGNAYESEGHVLFSSKSYKEYGQLSGRIQDDLVAGARIAVASYKKDSSDFVLWKPSDEGEPFWNSPWGKGRPGWHIECSVMSTKYLGNNFDIHGGGADLQFPHHENEIAQSCCANHGSEYAKYWVHNGFLTVNGEKMSKSLGNFVTVDEALASSGNKYQGQIIRLMFLNTHYKKPLDWNKKALGDAAKMMDYFYEAIRRSEEYGQEIADSVKSNIEFLASLASDMNTAAAITTLHKIAKKINSGEDLSLGHELIASGKVLGLFHQVDAQGEQAYISASDWFASEDIPEDILALVEEIKIARINKDYTTADSKRDAVISKGYAVEYLPKGKILVKKNV
jgi:cysteinyl-tRNA synthetase